MVNLKKSLRSFEEKLLDETDSNLAVEKYLAVYLSV